MSKQYDPSSKTLSNLTAFDNTIKHMWDTVNNSSSIMETSFTSNEVINEDYIDNLFTNHSINMELRINSKFESIEKKINQAV